MDVADCLAENVTKTYLLHDVLAKVELPLDEVAAASLVAIEIPPKMPGRFEHALLQLASKIKAHGPELTIISIPQAKRQSQVALWIHRWNKLEQIPFKFERACSCQLQREPSSIHLAMMIGSATRYTRGSPCYAVPSSGCSRQALIRELDGSLSTFMAFVPPDRRMLPP